MLKIKNVLQTKGAEVWSIYSDAAVYEALKIMADRNVGALLVIDDDELVGIFSERDYARKVVLRGTTSLDSSIKELPVKELMTREVYTVGPDDTIEECMALMAAARCRHMPVFKDDKLLGVVSIGDVVNSMISQQKVKIRDLEKYIRGGYS